MRCSSDPCEFPFVVKRSQIISIIAKYITKNIKIVRNTEKCRNPLGRPERREGRGRIFGRSDEMPRRASAGIANGGSEPPLDCGRAGGGAWEKGSRRDAGHIGKKVCLLPSRWRMGTGWHGEAPTTPAPRPSGQVRPSRHRRPLRPSSSILFNVSF